MNGFSYLPTTNSHVVLDYVRDHRQLKKPNYVPRQPHVIHEKKSEITYGMADNGGGGVLVNGELNMYDNVRTVWAPKNRGGIRMNKVYPEGTFGNTGSLDPKFNSSPKLSQNKYIDVRTTFRRTYYNQLL